LAIPDQVESEERLSRSFLNGEKRRLASALSFETRISELDFLEFAAINEKFHRNSHVGTDTYQAPTPPIDGESCCNVRSRYSHIKGNIQQIFAFQAAISQFGGNIYLVDLSRNRCLTPKGSMTVVLPFELALAVVVVQAVAELNDDSMTPGEIAEQRTGVVEDILAVD
jgi:hypothetical protein